MVFPRRDEVMKLGFDSGMQIKSFRGGNPSRAPGYSFRGVDTVYVHQYYVDKCQNGDCADMEKIVLGENQHTRFGGSQDDPGRWWTSAGQDLQTPINKELRGRIETLDLGEPSISTPDGPMDIYHGNSR